VSDTTDVEEQKPFRWLSEIYADPDALAAPFATAPRLAWRGRLTLLAASPKGGKSTLAGAAVAAVSRGADFLGASTVAGNVLVISLEESTADFARRMARFGANPNRVAVIDRTASQDLLKNIWETAEIVKPDLIVWDTLGAFASHISGKPLEPGDGQGWTRVMMEILDLARSYGATLLLHHARRSDGKYRDSSAIGANVDVILEMFGENDAPRVIKGIGRFEISETRIKLEGDEFVLMETEAEVQEKVRAFIGTHPRCTWRDIRKGVSGRDVELQKARDALVKKGAIVNTGTPTEHRYMLGGAVPGKG
jgi:hypothetical protein